MPSTATNSATIRIRHLPVMTADGSAAAKQT
jgi:hypothetical protein